MSELTGVGEVEGKESGMTSREETWLMVLPEIGRVERERVWGIKTRILL